MTRINRIFLCVLPHPLGAPRPIPTAPGTPTLLMYAMGPAGSPLSSCQDYPEYHGYNRGIFYADFAAAANTFRPEFAC